MVALVLVASQHRKDQLNPQQGGRLDNTNARELAMWITPRPMTTTTFSG